jgi:hypothetical protein
MSAAMTNSLQTTNANSLQMMTGVLTTPYRRGAETKTLTPGETLSGWTAIEPYDFAEYEARYEASPPEPRYVLFMPKGTGNDALDFEVEYFYGDEDADVNNTDADVNNDDANDNDDADDGVDDANTAAAVARVGVPAFTAAGASFVIPTPLGADSTLRLSRVRVRPVAARGATGDDDWQIVALLGNTAKLAWVLAWEKNQIRRGLEMVASRRHLAAAEGHSLDMIGEGLRIPRFPARPYSFDAHTVALYHFDGAVGDNAQVEDAMGMFGGAGLHGTAHGTVESAPGKFGRAFRFPGRAGTGFVGIPSHAQFAVGAVQSFTVEAFVKVDGVQDIYAAPRPFIMKGLGDVTQSPPLAGWMLSVGGFRGIANNVGWSLADDEGRRIEVFADLDIADRRFHHLACVLDRDGGKARLFVDGEERAAVALDQLGAVTNDEEIIIGGVAASRFVGVIDEVRFSNVARREFHPVLGEGDEQYRERLAVFSRQLVPSPVALAEAVNRLVKINGDSPSFVVVESDRETATAHCKIKVLPRELRRGARVTAAGDTRANEAQAAGVPADEPEFDAAWLVSHNDRRADYDNADARRMQLGAALMLERLLERLSNIQPAVAGRLVVRGAFNAAATDLRRVGRSLLITHTQLSPGRLAVHAHAAGFDYVSHERSGLVKVSVRKSEPMAIELSPEPLPAASPVLSVGRSYEPTLSPPPPDGAKVRWTVVRGGAGDGEVESGEGDAITTFRALAAGVVLLRAEVTLRHQTVRASRYLRIAPASLAPGETLGGDGRTGVGEEEAAGPKSENFDERYLLSRTDAQADYGADPRNRRMQLGASRALDRLLAIQPGGTTLRVTGAFLPGASDLRGEGRALLLSHSTLAPAALAPLAFAAGFDFIRHDAGQGLYVSVARSELIAVVGPDEVEVDATVELELEPQSLEVSEESGDTVEWAGIPLTRGRVELAAEDGEAARGHRRVTVTGREPGMLAVRAMYLHGGKIDPYAFSLRLVPELDNEETYIAKDQYDVIVNLLSRLHPVGVKVLTDDIRRRVVEVREGQLDAFPGYTYPKF